MNGTSDLLFAVGYRGGYELMRRAFNASSWDDADFDKDIKVRIIYLKSRMASNIS